MKKLWIFGAGFCLAALLFPGPIRAEGEVVTPDEMYRQAYLLERSGRKAIYEEDLPAAYAALTEAQAAYEELARIHPEWQSAAVQSRIASARTEAETVGRKIFSLPEGMLEIKPDMVREGNRYDEGRMIAGKVKDLGEGKYEVADFTVTVVRSGPLLGAACTGPDFTYRGSKHGFACKHIWAVILHAKLLE